MVLLIILVIIIIINCKLYNLQEVTFYTNCRLSQHRPLALVGLYTARGFVFSHSERFTCLHTASASRVFTYRALQVSSQQALHVSSHNERFTCLHTASASCVFTYRALHVSSHTERFTCLHTASASRVFTQRALHVSSHSERFTCLALNPEFLFKKPKQTSYSSSVV
jgi:hypothetical protein